ncbi:MAG: hypothetical protein U5J96_04110 [Ignavibacteriaceae bacterium]|nr:hypothetical protein [Ignavibacteriaceae bacterium]
MLLDTLISMKYDLEIRVDSATNPLSDVYVFRGNDEEILIVTLFSLLHYH